jgi:citrate lyase subunit beta/citryl-CoA lyase
MQPARSLLFIPGNREKWLKNAHTYGADVVIFDLEDAVPPDEKEDARELVGEYVPKIHDKGQTVFVRVNGHPNDPDEHTERDLEAVVCEELAAVFVPKAKRPSDIEKLDTVISYIERRDRIEDSTELVVAIETALGMKNVHELCTTSERVGTITCGAVKGTDTNHALGFEWTGPGEKGLETLHMREKALLDARAGGIKHPIAGTYVDIDDMEGLREDMHFSREMGYQGYLLIHPTQVELANDIFTPDEETVEYWVGAKQALTEAAAEGKSAVQYEGDMMDTATLSTAEQYLRRAKAFEEDIDVDLTDVSVEY